MNYQQQFSFHYPGMVYSAHWFAKDITQAKKEIREYLGVKRLPNGFCIWKYVPLYTR